MSSRAAVQAQWPILLVGLIFATALVLVGANFWRRGSLLIGVGVGVAAALRLVLSDERAGLLVVRGRGIDFLTTATVAAAMVYIAWTIDPLGTG
ncbi:MAG: DUF3017 domain-containing protein [Mycobacterium sp.]|jgi:hypothetical protein|uniref:DUF3017 domain-containing protein n=1 Tax=Mycobacterium sp. TaxID=1785 RepID=UPI003C4D3686